VNSIEGPEWKVWERPAGHRSRSLLAFSAGEASRRQGNEAFERFHLALLRARHEDGLTLTEPDTIRSAAEIAELDVAQLEQDMQDPMILNVLARDHEEGVALGVFGTPTLVFEEGGSAFLKMRPGPPPEESVDVFDALRTFAATRPYIAEIKRPSPPG
jgi:protein-disulfide isomerase